MNKQVTRRPKKQDLRKERREEQIRREAERKREEKRRRITIISVIVAVLVITGAIVTYVVYANSQPQSSAQQIVNPNYPPVDNIYCDQLEQTAFHVHAHLTMYINGQALPLPAQIGIATDQSCFYWLHTHDTTGVIHIEAPANHAFLLGNFLNVWSTQFSALGYPPQLDQAGWQVYVNGKLYKGDFHKIPLDAHALITMAYNSPHITPDTTYNWNGL